MVKHPLGPVGATSEARNYCLDAGQTVLTRVPSSYVLYRRARHGVSRPQRNPAQPSVRRPPKNGEVWDHPSSCRLFLLWKFSLDEPERCGRTSEASATSRLSKPRAFFGGCRNRLAAAGSRSRTAVASGVPSSGESERSREFGRQQVLDHNPGAPVTLGSKCQIPIPARAAALPVGPEQHLECSRAPRNRRSRVEGCRPRSRGRTASSCPTGSTRNCCLEKGIVEPSARQTAWVDRVGAAPRGVRGDAAYCAAAVSSLVSSAFSAIGISRFASSSAQSPAALRSSVRVV